ncbi:hypothetical protein BN3661_01607 [Eubacteriaceae bacterium CHKCI005]|nr:hypothetical protein BN3661_01607 [Eubacteriaceae bacterium CHKCI005]
MKLKKVISTALCAAALTTMLAVPVSAATINAPEQKIVDRIATGIELNDVTVTVPDGYINSMKNFFLSIEMTEEQGTQINGYLDKVQAVLEKNADAIVADGKLVMSNLNSLSKADKQELLDNAQKACELVGLVFSFDSATKNVVIKDKDGKVWFDNAPIIKRTDGEQNNIMLYSGLILAAVVLVSAGSYAVVKKAKGRA